MTVTEAGRRLDKVAAAWFDHSMAGAWRHAVVKFVLVGGKLETAEDVERFLAPSGPAALRSQDSR